MWRSYLRVPDSVLDFSSNLLGAYENLGFFGLKPMEVSRIEMKLGRMVGGTRADALDVF